MRAATVRAGLDLARIGNLPTVWSNVLAAGVLTVGAIRPGYVLLAAAALSAFYMAGMVLNDLCDLDHDRRFRPQRPLPAGRLSVAAARRLTLSLFAAGFLLLAFAPDRSGLYAGLLLALTIVAYDRRHKENPGSVLLMAACRFLVFAVTALAVSGRLPAAVLVAGGAQFLYVLLLSLVARHENARPQPFSVPLIPLLLAGIPLLDGIVLALLVHPGWLLAGVGGFVLTRLGQRFVRGD